MTKSASHLFAMSLIAAGACAVDEPESDVPRNDRVAIDRAGYLSPTVLLPSSAPGSVSLDGYVFGTSFEGAEGFTIGELISEHATAGYRCTKHQADTISPAPRELVAAVGLRVCGGHEILSVPRGAGWNITDLELALQEQRPLGYRILDLSDLIDGEIGAFGVTTCVLERPRCS